MNPWIMGRVLQPALDTLGVPHRFGAFKPTARVHLDIAQDSYVLGLDRDHGLPFVVEGGLMVTIHDFDLSGSSPTLATSAVYELANLRFTRRALDSATAEFVADDPKNLTTKLHRNAQQLAFDDPRQVLKFSKSVVVAWGRGHRVWGNIVKRHHPNPDDYARRIARWLRSLPHYGTPAQALEVGVQIKGLEVSFASKHLRIVDPDRYVTLDDVVSRGLGYALNTAGYTLWLHDLRRLKFSHDLPYRLGDLEGGIFALVRQLVRVVDAPAPRSSPPQPRLRPSAV